MCCKKRIAKTLFHIAKTQKYLGIWQVPAHSTCVVKLRYTFFVNLNPGTPFLHCISSFQGTFYENYFILFYISFCITRYHFSQLLRTLFNITWKKIFVMIFPFLMDSLNPPPPHLPPANPLCGQNLLSMTKNLGW